MKLSHIIIGFFLLLSLAGLVGAENGVADPTSASSALTGTETRLLPTNFDVWSCDWSPDGKAVVFAGKNQGDDATKMRIWYWPQDPISDPAPLTNTDQLIDFSPRWSPDGSKIILNRRAYNNGASKFTSTLWLKEIPSGAGRQLTAGPEDRDPSWAPDGARVVFSRGQGPYQAQLLLVNVIDGSTKILAGQEGELLTSPWWGANGKIYYSRLTPYQKTVTVGNQVYKVMDFGKGGIWALNPATGRTEPVVVDDYDNRQPALSPDRTKLAFVSNRVYSKDGNGKFDRGSLFIKNLNTGELVFITNKVGLNGGALSWSPDGKKLAFFTFRSIRPAVWVINIP